jgi:hypothetical protein
MFRRMASNPQDWTKVLHCHLLCSIHPRRSSANHQLSQHIGLFRRKNSSWPGTWRQLSCGADVLVGDGTEADPWADRQFLSVAVRISRLSNVLRLRNCRALLMLHSTLLGSRSASSRATGLTTAWQGTSLVQIQSSGSSQWGFKYYLLPFLA